MDRFIRENVPESMISTADAIVTLYERLTTPLAQSPEESFNRLRSVPEVVIRDAITNGVLPVQYLDANGTKRRLTVEHWQRWCSDSVRSVSIGVFMGQSINTETERQTCHGVSIYFDAVDWKKWLGERPVASADEIKGWTLEFTGTRDEMEKAAAARFGPGQRDTVRDYWKLRKEKRGRKSRQISR